MRGSCFQKSTSFYCSLQQASGMELTKTKFDVDLDSFDQYIPWLHLIPIALRDHLYLSDDCDKSCPKCGKVYSSKARQAFAFHVQTHIKKFECPVCSKTFSRPWLLKIHLRTHYSYRYLLTIPFAFINF